MCGLVLTIGLARFAYTPLLPSLQAQTGLNDANAGVLAAINYAGYMSGAIAVAWIDDVRWRHWLYSTGLWVALLITALMAVAPSFEIWAVSRFVGGLCGAAGMLLGSGLVLGWLMRNGQRPELGLHFVGIGLGIVVSAIGAWGLSAIWPNWDAQWFAFAGIGLIFLWPAWSWRPPVPEVLPLSMSATNAQPVIPTRWLWTMLVSYFAAGWGFVISATFTVAIVEREPLLAGQGHLAWAMVGLAAMPAVFVWDRVARLVGDKQALLIAFALQTLSVLMPAASGSMFSCYGRCGGLWCNFHWDCESDFGHGGAFIAQQPWQSDGTVYFGIWRCANDRSRCGGLHGAIFWIFSRGAVGDSSRHVARDGRIGDASPN